jgi:hypothetical protein
MMRMLKRVVMMMIVVLVASHDDVKKAGHMIVSASDSSSVSPYMAYSSYTCGSYADYRSRCAKISSNILSTGRAFHPNAVAYVPSI